MNPVIRRAGSLLAIPLAMTAAGYMSIISAELLADNYSLIVDPSLPSLAPGLAQDLDPTGVERAHREKIITRIVTCSGDCAPPAAEWGTFLSISNEKQHIAADPNARDSAQRSEDRVITAGIDRRFGRHLVGLTLGASDGEGQIERNEAEFFGNVHGLTTEVDTTLNTERDKYTAGLYYGLQLPYFVTFSAAMRTNRDRFYSYWIDAGTLKQDSARYDGDGYSGTVALSAIVPLISGDFSFMLQPSVSYQLTRSESDPYVSELGNLFGVRTRRSKELEAAAKWQAPFIAGQTVWLPFGGFSFTHLEQRANRDVLDSGNVIVTREHDLLEGLVGVSVQHGDFNAAAMYKKTIGRDDLERERYQLTLRLRF